MASYLIKKDEKTNQIIYMEYEMKGYEFSPKLKSDAYIKINQITLINPSMIEKILIIKLKKSFKKIAYNALRVISDENATDGDVSLALNEVRRLASIIINKYDKFLKKTIEKEYLTRLSYMEKELEMKEILLREKFLSEDLEMEKGHSR